MASRVVEALVVGALMVLALLLNNVSSAKIVFPETYCADGDPKCPGLAAVGHCTSNPVFMTSLCPFSCNLCVMSTDSTTTTSQPDTATSYQQHYSNLQIETTIVPRRSIVNPDFECGGLPSPAHSRTKRQATVQDQQRRENHFAFQATSETGDGAQRIEQSSCGASVISDRFLLTAAYCVIDRLVTSVHLGDIDLAQDNENNSMPADYGIAEIILPPGFDNKVRYNDIALLKTDRKIEFNDFVFPYCVSASQPAVSTEVIAAGFGFINQTHKTTHLMEATLGVLPLAQCEDRYLQNEEQRLKEAYPSLLQGRNGLLCAGDEISGVCTGDEGSPLFREDQKGRRFIEGIISFTGSVCSEGVLPGIFTAVADYVDFIDDAIYGKENL